MDSSQSAEVDLLTDRQHVVVIGAGAMGGLWAGRLSHVGHRVTIVDPSPTLLEAVRSHGMVVVDGDDRIVGRPMAVATPLEAEPADIALIFVKGPHTSAVAEAIPAIMKPDTVVATLQNGWGNADVLASAVPADRLVVGVTYEGATILEPGIVRRTGAATTEVGPYAEGGDDAPARVVSALLNESGFACETRADVRTAIWRKLIHNASVLPVSALTRLRGAQLVEAPVLELVDRLIDESVDIAQALGYDIDLQERRTRIHAVMGGSGRSTPSMLADVEAHRATEVDFVNGAIVRAAEKLGRSAPLNEAMVALVHGLEQGWAE